MSRKMITVELTPVEARHLLNLLEADNLRGDYYGPQAQYYARTERLMWRLQQGLDDH